MKRLSAVLVFMVALVALSGTVFAWPGYVEGKPDMLHSRDAQGYFIWHDRQGLHLRTTTKGREHVYTGVIRTNGKFVNIDDYRTERNDHIRVSKDRDTIWFRFTTDGGLDGLDFLIRGGDRMSFDLYMDGRQISRKQVYLGDRGVHPKDNTFTLRREHDRWDRDEHDGRPGYHRPDRRY